MDDRARKLCALLALTFSASVLAGEADTYIGCLKEAIKGTHNLNAKEIRSLCQEISGTQNPVYLWSEDGTSSKPANSFTKCYDKGVKEFQSLGNKQSGEVAKIVCRYKAR